MRIFLIPLLTLAASPALSEPSPSPDELTKKIRELLLPHARELAADPAIVEAVREANRVGKPKIFSLKEWQRLSVEAPEVTGLQGSAAAQALQRQKKPFVSEAFLSAADGRKLAFLEKTSFFIHKGKPKHDLPMQGREWIGKAELDASSGVHQVQVAVPVLDQQGKPIGSLVIAAALGDL